MENELEVLRLLHTEPSVQRWIDELRAVLYGHRESRLLQLGGIQEYIEVIQANSSDPPAARTLFGAALREFVMEWQPAKFQSVEYVELMLDLLAAFTPDMGFIKIVEQLRDWGEFTPEGADEESVVRIKRRALEVLRNYFPVAPPARERDNSWPAFQSYVAVLRDNLAAPSYCGLALSRLIDLHILEIGSEEVRVVIRANSHAMADLVDYSFQSGDQARLEWYLRQLYPLATETSQEVRDEFERALKEAGASLNDSDSGSVITLPTGAEISLQPPVGEDNLSKYMQTRWKRAQKAYQTIEKE